MGVIAEYLVSAAAPSNVGGTGGGIKYFASNPPQSLWNTGVTGVNSPVTSAQLGATPSSSSALGQLSFDSVASKIVNNRFRIYASGVASSTTTPTITPIVQLNTGTIASPTYVTLLGPAASGALVASQPVAWSIEGKLYFESTSGSLYGFFNYQYASTSTGTAASSATDAAITARNGLTAGGIYATQFGFVVGITFGTSDASNSASLYEFKIVQD